MQSPMSNVQTFVRLVERNAPPAIIRRASRNLARPGAIPLRPIFAGRVVTSRLGRSPQTYGEG